MYKNTVNLIGFLGKDAEVKAAQDNSTNFTVLSLATKESWKNKQTNELIRRRSSRIEAEDKKFDVDYYMYITYIYF